MSQNKEYPVTPDGHYFVVRWRLWRCSNPALSEPDRQRLVCDLMAARRLVKEAKDNSSARQKARQQVHAAKVGLGERGAPWWGDSVPTFDRCLAVNTPYKEWYQETRKTRG